MKTLRWGYRGVRYASPVIDHVCSFCGRAAVVKLTGKLLAEQPDDTTHLCHPLLGGCNQGFALDVLGPANQVSP